MSVLYKICSVLADVSQKAMISDFVSKELKSAGF